MRIVYVDVSHLSFLAVIRKLHSLRCTALYAYMARYIVRMKLLCIGVTGHTNKQTSHSILS